MNIVVQRFFNKFKVLHKKGIPGLLLLNEKLINRHDYNQKLKTMAKENSKFVGIQGSIKEASLGNHSQKHYSLN
jgi:hypothetical protein